MQALCAASLVFLACIVVGSRPSRSTGVMSFFLNFTFVSGISLFFAASEIFGKGVKNAVDMGVMLGLD